MLGVRAPAPSAGRSPWRGSRRPAHGGEGRQSGFAPPACGWEREEDRNRCSEPGLEMGGACAAKCVSGQRRRWPGSSWTSDSSEPSLPADLIIFQGRLGHPALRLGAPSPSRPLPSHRHRGPTLRQARSSGFGPTATTSRPPSGASGPAGETDTDSHTDIRGHHDRR